MSDEDEDDDSPGMARATGNTHGGLIGLKADQQHSEGGKISGPDNAYQIQNNLLGITQSDPAGVAGQK
jgi:hypothetical protein